ncbi:MAG: zinc metallopeptidase [Pseudomonadota bacterium]
MLVALGSLIVAVAVYGPSLWVRWVMRAHGNDIAEMPGTGGELATHLLQRFEMGDYRVEECPPGTDHYDPGARTVRLSPGNFAGKSLTAISVAAHEVGHALQHHREEQIFRLRSRYVPTAKRLERLGVALLWLMPFMGLLTRSPGAVFGVIGLSLLLQLAGALAYLIVLPEELDASFNKALPILKDGEYIAPHQEEAVRSVLRAAALTYFAAALANVLNIGRWIMVLLRR